MPIFSQEIAEIKQQIQKTQDATAEKAMRHDVSLLPGLEGYGLGGLNLGMHCKH